MPLQDLTPQLRTRLNRMERAVGWFVFLATALLIFGFGYYVQHLAKQRGWFVIKAKFHTYLQSSAGLNVGDPVYMMGFSVGQITSVHPMQPRDPHNVRVEFEVLDPYFRYIWTGGSYVKVNAAGFLNQRQIEITRGTNGYAIVVTQPVSILTLDEAKELVEEEPDDWQLSQDLFDANSNLIFHAYTPLSKMFDPTNAESLAKCRIESNSIYAYDNKVERKRIVASWHPREHRYDNFTPDDETAWLHAAETPPVADQLQAMVGQVQSALPRILELTNQLATVLANGVSATSNLNADLAAAQPLLTNFAAISGQLREPGGAVNWLLGTNGGRHAQGILTNADSILAGAGTNLTAILIHFSDITSNLSAQAQANTNMLSSVTKIVVDTDDFVQGLKRHWLFRSAFKEENSPKNTNAPPPDLRPPRMR